MSTAVVFGSIKTNTILGFPLMFLINFQLWARNREIPGAGSFYIRGGLMLGGRDHLGSPKRDHNLDNHPYVHLHPANSCSLSQDKICFL